MSVTEHLPARSLKDLVQTLVSGADARAGDQRRALAVFLLRLASAAIAYASQVLLARWMGAFEYGVYAYVCIWVLLLGIVSSLGMSASVVRFVPSYRQRGDDDRLRGFLFRSVTITLAASTALMLASFGVLFALSDVVADYYLLPLLLAALCLPMFGLSEIQDGIGRAFSWLDAALLPPYILRPLLLLALMLVTVGLDLAPANALTAVGCAVAATWIAALLQSAVLFFRVRRTVAPGPRRYDAGDWVAVSLPFMVMEGFYLLMSHTDVLVLDLFTGPEDIAVYFAAAKTTSLIAFVHFAVLSVVTPQFARHHAAGDEAALSATLHDASLWIFWPSLLGAAAILALGWPLLWLFGPEFDRAYPVMFILSAGLVVRAAMGPADALLNMMGHQKLTMVVLLGAAMLNIVLNVVLIPPFGLEGAALATAVALSLQALILLVLARRKLGLRSGVFGAATGSA